MATRILTLLIMTVFIIPIETFCSTGYAGKEHPRLEIYRQPAQLQMEQLPQNENFRVCHHLGDLCCYYYCSAVMLIVRTTFSLNVC